MKEIKLSQDTYDDEALNVLSYQGFHYPTAILADCLVIIDYEHDEMDSYEAEEFLRNLLSCNKKTKGVVLFVHSFTHKLMRVSVDFLTNIDEKIQLN